MAKLSKKKYELKIKKKRKKRKKKQGYLTIKRPNRKKNLNTLKGGGENEKTDVKETYQINNQNT